MSKKAKKRLEKSHEYSGDNSQTELECETNHKRKRQTNLETKTDKPLRTSAQKFNEWILEKSRQYTNSVRIPEEDKSEENSEIKEKKQIKKPKDKEKIRLKKLKIKEEKLKKRAENQMNEKLAGKNALDYLHQWELQWELHNDTWSFKKNRQSWLLKHLYDDQQISDEDFEILLRYLENVKGIARERIVSEAENKIKEYEKQIEKNENTEENSTKENIKEYRRAGLLIQILV